MTDKDPKDMTVSELLRATADSIREGVSSRGARFSSADSIDEFREMLDVDSEPTYAEDMTSTLSVLADKIDAELSDARAEGIEASLRAGAEIWAKANGWPDFRDGEDFGTWLDRCAIPRPRFEDGEPVHIGDKAEHPYTGETCTIDCINTFDGSYCLGFVEESSASLLDRERVKRPDPEVLGADGLPLDEDDTVYGMGREQHRYTVQVPYSINEVIGQRFCVQCYDHDEGNITWCDPSMLTHTPPDTLERLRDDMYRTAEEWREADSVSIPDMNHWADRLAALIERKGGE